MAFQLPLNVTAQRIPITATSFEFVLRHHRLGLIGRIRIEEEPCGCCIVLPELCPSEASTVTEQRRTVFDPIARAVTVQYDTSIVPACIGL